jgi:Fur family transcriptional regulator, ferric uptake regulator
VTGAVLAERSDDRVLAVLTGCVQPLSVTDIHRALIATSRSMSLATVYRSLARLVNAGKVHSFRWQRRTGYLACSTTDHDHLVCRRCRRVTEVRAFWRECPAGTAISTEFTSVHLDIWAWCEQC